MLEVVTLSPCQPQQPIQTIVRLPSYIGKLRSILEENRLRGWEDTSSKKLFKCCGKILEIALQPDFQMATNPIFRKKMEKLVKKRLVDCDTKQPLVDPYLEGDSLRDKRNIVDFHEGIPPHTFAKEVLLWATIVKPQSNEIVPARSKKSELMALVVRERQKTAATRLQLAGVSNEATIRLNELAQNFSQKLQRVSQEFNEGLSSLQSTSREESSLLHSKLNELQSKFQNEQERRFLTEEKVRELQQDLIGLHAQIKQLFAQLNQKPKKHKKFWIV